MTSKQWVAKPPHKFCKQKISDNPESRIILKTVSILPLKCLMPYFVMMWSGTSYEVLIKKKKKRKIEQKLVAINKMICRAYRYYLYLQLLGATHQGFPSSKPTHLTEVSNITLYFVTYLLSAAQFPKTGVSWAALILKWFYLPNPFSVLSIKLEAAITPILNYSVQYQTMLHYTILQYTLLYNI